MAIRFYALSGQVSLVQKVRVWGKMLVLVAATGFGTEMVDACSPAPSVPLNEMSMYTRFGLADSADTGMCHLSRKTRHAFYGYRVRYVIGYRRHHSRSCHCKTLSERAV